jgi:hypothetical protein
VRSMTPVHAAALLGVEPGACVEDVKNAFRQYARRHHPDHGGDRERFDAVVAARDVLLLSAAASGRQRVFLKHEPWWRQLTTRRS